MCLKTKERRNNRGCDESEDFPAVGYQGRRNRFDDARRRGAIGRARGSRLEAKCIAPVAQDSRNLGGFPRELSERGETPADYGINAVWIGSGSLDAAKPGPPDRGLL